MWPFSRRKVLIVSERTPVPALDSGFLQQPKIHLLSGYPDDAGLQLARRMRPALIVEHVASQDGPAVEFCEDLRTHPRTRKIPLILVAESGLGPELTDLGADALLSKPLDRDEFFHAVRRFVPLPERSSPRAQVNLRFRYKVDAREAQAFGRDISLSGAYIKSDRSLPLGTTLELEFTLPGTSRAVLCSAVVRSGARRHPRYGPGGFGVEFQEMREEDAARLRRFVESCTRHGRR
jgi:uncharacterized protein (TIGR02266 family)